MLILFGTICLSGLCVGGCAGKTNCQAVLGFCLGQWILIWRQLYWVCQTMTHSLSLALLLCMYIKLYLTWNSFCESRGWKVIKLLYFVCLCARCVKFIFPFSQISCRTKVFGLGPESIQPAQLFLSLSLHDMVLQFSFKFLF